MADDRGGTGLVYAALSREPLDLARFGSGMHWDYNKLRLEGEDAEAELTWLVRQASSNGRFEYDLLGYRVFGPGFEEAQPVIVAGGGGWYDPYFDCLACGGYAPGTSLRIGLGLGGGFYDPWYNPWFDPWYPYGVRTGYGFGGFGGFGGFRGGYPVFGRPGRPITVFPTFPRPTVPNTVYGVRSRPSQPVPTTTRGREASVPNTPSRTGSGSGGTTAPVRPRAPQTEPTRARPAADQAPTRPAPSAGARPVERTSPPPTANRPTTPTVQNEGRTRRSDDDRVMPSAAPAPRVTAPTMDRRGIDRTVTMPERPVYRPPTPVRTSGTERRAEPTRGGDRPVSAPPRQQERSAPARTRSVERPPAPAPRPVERPSAPAARSAPPATRSSPPPSRPASPAPSNSSGRSRSSPSGDN